jgi:NTP pyrophosphatase (non-canonical NTP hydrolase)
MEDSMREELRAHLDKHLNWAPAGADRLRFLILALCGEAGELANLAKKQWRDGGDRREEMISEIADVANYTAMLAMHLGIDLQSAMLKKLIEVEQRPSWRARVKEAI